MSIEFLCDGGKCPGLKWPTSDGAHPSSCRGDEDDNLANHRSPGLRNMSRQPSQKLSAGDRVTASEYIGDLMTDGPLEVVQIIEKYTSPTRQSPDQPVELLLTDPAVQVKNLTSGVVGWCAASKLRAVRAVAS